MEKTKFNEINNKIKKFKQHQIQNCETIKKLKFYEFNDFLTVSDKIEEYLSEFTDELERILPEDADMQSINFLLYEVLINVYKHSKFENAYVEVNDDETLDIIIYDDGIGIPNSFKEAGLEYTNDSESIFEAINGKTTDKEKYNLHGRGLNSTARITTFGFGGKMFIFSGTGGCLITKDGVQLYRNEKSLTGTFILLQINNKKIDNIYDYLKYEPIHKRQNNE